MNLDKKIRALNHKRIDAFRLFKLKISNFLFAPFSRTSVAHNGAILVLRMDDKLGDSVTATGFLFELKKKHNNSKLIVLASKSTESLYSKLNFIDDIYIAKKGIFNTLKLFFKLKKNNYKFIINTSHILNPRVLFLSSFLSAERKISIENHQYKLFTDHINVNFKEEHITDRYKNILKTIGIESCDLSYRISVSDEVLRSAQNYLSQKKMSTTKIVALNSFAGARLRNFNQKTTQAIVRRLISDPNVLVVSLASSGDMKIINQWIDQTFLRQWIGSAEPHSLEMNMALLKLADVVITPDTAWVHIASALNKKLVAIYREDGDSAEKNSIIWAPYHDQFRLIFAPSTNDNPHDINNVDIDQIVSETTELLNKL